MTTTEMQVAKAPAGKALVGRDGGPAATEQQQYLTFLLAEEMFAIGILAIREIIEYGFVTDVPMTPPFIRGVLNLRGAVVPVVDLAARFGRVAREISKRTCIVIVDSEAANGSQQQMGVVVDAVSEVLEIADGDIEPPPEFGARIRNDFIKSMGKINGKFVVILDLNRVLSVEEVAVVANIGQSATLATS
ncbi:MAG: chemotaxis protein CheW [Proteobacteria bacterium]|nr:chemotaxis protein CheW [Pseudomonadota bacterium]